MAALPHSDEAPIDLCMLWLELVMGGSGMAVGGHGLPFARSWAALWVDDRAGIGEDVVHWWYVQRIGNCRKMHFFCIFLQYYLHIWEKSSIFASDLGIVPSATI